MLTYFRNVVNVKLFQVLYELILGIFPLTGEFLRQKKKNELDENWQWYTHFVKIPQDGSICRTCTKWPLLSEQKGVMKRMRIPNSWQHSIRWHIRTLLNQNRWHLDLLHQNQKRQNNWGLQWNDLRMLAKFLIGYLALPAFLLRHRYRRQHSDNTITVGVQVLMMIELMTGEPNLWEVKLETKNSTLIVRNATCFKYLS